MATVNASFLQLDDAAIGGAALASWLQLQEPVAASALASFLQIQGAPIVTIPAAPSLVVGDATGVSTATITLQDNSGDEDGFEYQVEEPSGSGNWVAAIGDANPTLPGVTTFNATGLIGPILKPRARAFNFSGASAWVEGLDFGLDNPGTGGAPIPAAFNGSIVYIEPADDTAALSIQWSTTEFETVSFRESGSDTVRIHGVVASSRVSGGMLAALAAEFALSRATVGLYLDPVEVLNCAIKATRFYSGWATLDDPNSNLGLFTITGDTTVLPDEWAIISPLFVLYVERESAVAIESSRVMGVDAVGRDSSTVAGEIQQIEAEIAQRAYVEPAFSVGFPSSVP